MGNGSRGDPVTTQRSNSRAGGCSPTWRAERKVLASRCKASRTSPRCTPDPTTRSWLGSWRCCTLAACPCKGTMCSRPPSRHRPSRCPSKQGSHKFHFSTNIRRQHKRRRRRWPSNGRRCRYRPARRCPTRIPSDSRRGIEWSRHCMAGARHSSWSYLDIRSSTRSRAQHSRWVRARRTWRPQCPNRRPATRNRALPYMSRRSHGCCRAPQRDPSIDRSRGSGSRAPTCSARSGPTSKTSGSAYPCSVAPIHRPWRHSSRRSRRSPCLARRPDCRRPPPRCGRRCSSSRRAQSLHPRPSRRSLSCRRSAPPPRCHSRCHPRPCRPHPPRRPLSRRHPPRSRHRATRPCLRSRSRSAAGCSRAA
jgi:hypothetical protein